MGFMFLLGPKSAHDLKFISLIFSYDSASVTCFKLSMYTNTKLHTNIDITRETVGGSEVQRVCDLVQTSLQRAYIFKNKHNTSSM